MANVYSFDGLLVFGLLFICTCAYLKKVPRVKGWLLAEKRGVWGVFYKASVIGTRLHLTVALSCVTMAFYVLFLKWPARRLDCLVWSQICLTMTTMDLARPHKQIWDEATWTLPLSLEPMNNVARKEDGATHFWNVVFCLSTRHTPLTFWSEMFILLGTVMKKTLTDTEINNTSVPLCAVSGQNGVVDLSLSVNSN